MNTAINHNNKGVKCLQQGHYAEALLELKKSAQQMYSTTQEMKKKMSTGGDEEMQQSETLCETQRCVITTGNSFIRSTALTMSSAEEPASQCTVESAVVLMNMALCYHLDNATLMSLPEALENAMTLYKMAYSLALQVMKEDARAHDIVLTSLNNLGQLHHEMGNFDKSKLYLEDLSAYVVYLSDGGERIMDSHEFMLNAMILRNPHKCAGAA